MAVSTFLFSYPVLLGPYASFLGWEVFVGDMVQIALPTHAVMMDATTIPRKEVSV